MSANPGRGTYASGQGSIMETTRERLFGMVRRITGMDEISGDGELVGVLGMDSLALVELTVDIEVEFDLSIPEDLEDVLPEITLDALADRLDGILSARVTSNVG